MDEKKILRALRTIEEEEVSYRRIRRKEKQIYAKGYDSEARGRLCRNLHDDHYTEGYISLLEDAHAVINAAPTKVLEKIELTMRKEKAAAGLFKAVAEEYLK